MRVVVIGAGGHARTVVSILKRIKDIEIECILDKEVRFPKETISGIAVVADFDILPGFLKAGTTGAVIAVGDNGERERYFKQLNNAGFTMINAVHPTANIAEDAVIGKGVVIAAGAIICPSVTIGDNAIINTGAIVEHEVKIAENVHVAPGVNIAGRVSIGRNSFIGIGATIRDNIAIGKNVVVGAGSVVLQDIADNIVVAGVPARPTKPK
jgi:sugar O-acyltransferase (sialic acid O-acetyltransferase NeuD family)